MALSVTDFLNDFPEFKRTDSALVAAKLRAAEAVVDRDRWGKLADSAVGNYAAHLLATSPLAEKSKFVERTGETEYLRTFERLQRRVGRRSPLVI